MKLSISNIAWSKEQDLQVYERMKIYGFTGLEIAPTRIFPEGPYENLERASKWVKKLWETYGFCVPSMQSIWFGRQEKLFGREEEREFLLAYTKKAIDFAESISCGNLVFGCPRNRSLPQGENPGKGRDFFRELGEYAYARKTVIGMEANPPIYHTNYINDTAGALELLKEVSSPGFRLNLDVGTMIQNQEKLSVLEGQVPLISHVHISEPGLKPIEKRSLHGELADLLRSHHYQGFVSIEMGRQDSLSAVEEAMAYVKEIFG